MSRRLVMTRAFAVALVATVAMGSSRAGAAPAHPARNGAIAFWAWTKIYAIQPNGTRLRVLVPPRARNCVIPRDREGECGVGAFAWSPDGRRLAFLHGPSTINRAGQPNIDDESLFFIGADGRSERRVAGCGHPWRSCREFAWSPDGSHLVASRFDGLFVVGADGSSVRRLTRSRTDSSPRWSPDGSRIAFTRGSGSAVYVIPADGSTSTRIWRNSGSWPWVLQWTADSSAVVFQRDDRLLEVPADGSGRPRSIEIDGSFDHTSLSPNGTRVAGGISRVVHAGTTSRRGADPSTYRSEIWTMQANATRRWRVYAGTAGVDGGLSLAPEWSPNGRRVAFADNAVYVVDADGSRLRRLSTLGHESIRIGREVAWQPIP